MQTIHRYRIPLRTPLAPGEETIKLAVIATVLLSIFAHGLTTLPGIRWYSRRVDPLDRVAPEYQG